MSSTRENFEGLVSPPGLPDLAQADLARALPLVCLSLAVGASTQYLDEFINSPANVDVLPAVEGFANWCNDNIDTGGRDGWLDYLAKSRADLVVAAWSAYDPDDLVEEIVRETVGDDLIGASLWFSYLTYAGVISDDDESKWASLWHFLAVSDLLSDDVEDPIEESTNVPPKEDEW
jgi:hypothetical protein